MIVTAQVEGAITISNVPQFLIPNDISFPAPAFIRSFPVLPKKLTQAEIDSIKFKFNRININPDSYIEVIRKYWDNVTRLIATGV